VNVKENIKLLDSSKLIVFGLKIYLLTSLANVAELCPTPI
jgi:hypothetical protein